MLSEIQKIGTLTGYAVVSEWTKLSYLHLQQRLKLRQMFLKTWIYTFFLWCIILPLKCKPELLYF